MFSRILVETNNLKIGHNFKHGLEGSATKEGGIIDRWIISSHKSSSFAAAFRQNKFLEGHRLSLSFGNIIFHVSELGVAMFSRIYLGESSAMTPVWDGRELLSSAAIKKSTFLSTASPLHPPSRNVRARSQCLCFGIVLNKDVHILSSSGVFL